MKYANLLLIEDDSMTAKLYQTLLEDFGYHVWVSPTANDAWSILQAQSIDLIVLDNQLPDQVGVEWLNSLRSEAAFSRLPVILISHMRPDNDLKSDKFVWVMEKPKQPQHIITAVQTTIEQFSV